MEPGMVEMKYSDEQTEKWLQSLEQFWQGVPSLHERFAELDFDEETEFLDEDYTRSKDHADALAEAELTPQQRARLDKVLAVRDEWQERLERLARGV